MRLWSLHPRYLDVKGLVACWRESLLAQKVLAGGTAGYRNHPQLIRFRAAADPIAAIGGYLSALATEATGRGYNFNSALILDPPAGRPTARLPVTEGQMDYEREHLLSKLRIRDHDSYKRLSAEPELPAPHPLFCIGPGDVEPWEIIPGPGNPVR